MRHIPFFLTLSRESQRNTLEALIFASDEPLTMKTMFKVLILEDGLHNESESDSDPMSDAFPLTDAEAEQEILDQASAKAAAEDTVESDVEDDESEGSEDSEGSDDSESSESSDNSEDTQSKEQSTVEEVVTKKSSAISKKKTLPDMAQLNKLVAELAQEINDNLIATERPYRVVRIASGYQFATTSEFGEVVARLMKSRTRRRLSQAALEALAIIAYKQPISKPEIEAIRGINSNEVINSLVEKNLVTLAGRSDAPGKPLLYGTTDDFLRMFGLHSTKDLPKLRELDDLFQNKAAELASGLDISVKTTSGELLEKIQALVDNEQKIEESERAASEAGAEQESTEL